jgi:hypothetical protein
MTYIKYGKVVVGRLSRTAQHASTRITTITLKLYFILAPEAYYRFIYTGILLEHGGNRDQLVNPD